MSRRTCSSWSRGPWSGRWQPFRRSRCRGSTKHGPCFSRRSTSASTRPPTRFGCPGSSTRRRHRPLRRSRHHRRRDRNGALRPTFVAPSGLSIALRTQGLPATAERASKKLTGEKGMTDSRSPSGFKGKIGRTLAESEPHFERRRHPGSSPNGRGLRIGGVGTLRSAVRVLGHVARGRDRTRQLQQRAGRRAGPGRDGPPVA